MTGSQTISSSANEGAIFESFLKICPHFADEPILNWHQIRDWYRATGLEPPAPPNHNRPDIICETESRRRVGVELKSWINEEQIAKAKRQEKFVESILRAIADLPANDTLNIKQVILKGRPNTFNKRDAEQLRTELFRLIREEDNNWTNKPKWAQSSTNPADLADFPTLRKYLTRVEVVPYRNFGKPIIEKRFRNVHWIRFPDRPSHFKVEYMLNALTEALSVTTERRYQNICNLVGLDAVFLLIHYDLRAFEYNTGIHTPNWSFSNTKDFARKTLGGDSGPFKGVFLFNSLPGQEELCRVH